ncbi:hypothetical protein DVS28_b0067 (plasmid) [Euzebya pacifica]|uniref:Uncharacterized protein n=2 Tax=Euzebya pacifica TaxID=1608957 RepID=A0A346Y5U0_9ACTN|nr:hypothetical protein DVS28_b0067 [Euzebya pacifica]
MGAAGAELVARATATEAARAVDAARLHRPLNDMSPLRHAIDSVRRDWTDRQRHDCDVVFLADHADGRRYALLYDRTAGHAMTGIWEGLGVAEPWSYWNNTDPPDDVDTTEWELRRRTWDRLLGNDPPAARGLTWRLHPAGPPIVLSRDTIIEHLPAERERAAAVALLLVIDDLLGQGLTAPDALTQALLGRDRVADRTEALLGRIEPINADDLTTAPVSARQDTMGP